MRTKAIQYITNFVVVTTTLFIVCWMVYCRVCKKDISLDLTSGDNIQKHYYFFLYLFISSVVVIFLILWSFRQAKNKEPGPITKLLVSSNLWLQKLNIFFRTYGILFNFIGHCRLKPLVDFAATVPNFSKNKNILIITIFVLLPRIAIIFIFIFELYIKQLHFYFFSLVLLLIPLIFRVVVFILKDLPERILPEFNKLLDISTNQESVEMPAGTPLTENAAKSFKGITIKYKPEYAATHDLDYFLFTYYYPMQFLGPYISHEFLPLYAKISKFMLLIYMVIQIIGWGYLLFFY